MLYVIIYFSVRDRSFNLQGGGGLWVFYRTTRELEYLFFFPEFNIRLYDKNSESDYFLFHHQNQNIFSATLGIRIFFFLDKKPINTPFKLTGRSLTIYVFGL